MNLKRTCGCAVVVLLAAFSLSGCTGFFTKDGGGSGNFIAGTGTPSKFVFTANTGSVGRGTVSGYSVGSDNTLSAVSGSPFASNDSQSRSIVADSSGSYVYVADTGSTITAGGIDAYSTSTAGVLTSVTGLTNAASRAANPTALALHGDILFAAFSNASMGSSSSSLAAFNLSSGTLSQVPQLSGNLLTLPLGSNAPTSVAVDPSSGTFVYVTDGQSIFGFKTSNGELTGTSQSGTTPMTLHTPNQIAVSTSGKFAFVAAGTAGIDTFSIDASSGVLTKLATYSTGGNAVALALDPRNPSGWVYAVNSDTNKIAGFSISATGTLTALSKTYSTGTTPTGIAIGPSGTAVYVTNSGSNTVGLYTINTDGTLNYVTAYATDNAPQALVVTP